MVPIRCSRSDDSPTSSGFAVGVDAVTTVSVSTPRTRTHGTAAFINGLLLPPIMSHNHTAPPSPLCATARSLRDPVFVYVTWHASHRFEDASARHDASGL